MLLGSIECDTLKDTELLGTTKYYTLKDRNKEGLCYIQGLPL